MRCPRPSHYFSFKMMMLLTILLFVLKIIVGKISNSMSLLADSFHMISDMAALIVGYLALKYSRLDGHDAKFSFGLARAEVLGALVNAIFLIAICFGVGVESLKRIVDPEEVTSPFPVLAVGCVGVFFNALGLVLFRWTEDRRKCSNYRTEIEINKDSKIEEFPNGENCSKSQAVGHAKWAHEVAVPHELNIRTIYLHCFSHVLSAFIVILSATCTVLLRTSWVDYIDPILSLVVIGFILHSCSPLLKESVALFMQSVPAGLKVKHLKERIHRTVPCIVDIHELHVWQLAGHKLVGSAHIVFESATDYNNAKWSLVKLFKDEGIDDLTLQPEFHTLTNSEALFHGKCLLECSTKKKCQEKKCCASHGHSQENIIIIPQEFNFADARETCL